MNIVWGTSQLAMFDYRLAVLLDWPDLDDHSSLPKVATNKYDVSTSQRWHDISRIQVVDRTINHDWMTGLKLCWIWVPNRVTRFRATPWLVTGQFWGNDLENSPCYDHLGTQHGQKSTVLGRLLMKRSLDPGFQEVSIIQEIDEAGKRSGIHKIARG